MNDKFQKLNRYGTCLSITTLFDHYNAHKSWQLLFKKPPSVSILRTIFLLLASIGIILVYVYSVRNNPVVRFVDGTIDLIIYNNMMEEKNMGFTQFIHTPEFEGKEKHVPDITVSTGKTGTVITVKVGKEVLHPTLKEHHIVWVKLFGETADGKFVEIGMLDFGEGTALPVGSIMVEISAYKTITALAYCNLHGVWDNSLTL